MKIKAIVKIDAFEREFEISCGFGDKQFKWLALVACQRFAAVPNGAVRRRDHFRGLTERAQHLPYEITLQNGMIPDPRAHLNDYLKDGDVVYVNLLSTQKVEPSSGGVAQSKWTNIAYHFDPKSHDPDEESSLGGGDFGESVCEEEAKDNPESVTSKAQFMRLVLESQMINQKFISHQMDSMWTRTISKAMPHLREDFSTEMLGVFKNNWDILKEYFNRFALDNMMLPDNLNSFLNETEVFTHSRDAAFLANRVHRRACVAIAKGQGLPSDCASSTIDFAGFLIALIICSQTRYNDTYEKRGRTDGKKALDELFSRCILPAAEHLRFDSVIKQKFCSEECLFAIRQFYNDIFMVFQKFALKSNELPESVTIENACEALAEARLQEPNNFSKTQEIFYSIKKGTIFGREPKLEGMSAIAEDEFTFPEFVEATARAGLNRLMSLSGGSLSGGEEEGHDGDSHSSDICFEDGLIEGIRYMAALNAS